LYFKFSLKKLSRFKAVVNFYLKVKMSFKRRKHRSLHRTSTQLTSISNPAFDSTVNKLIWDNGLTKWFNQRNVKGHSAWHFLHVPDLLEYHMLFYRIPYISVFQPFSIRGAYWKFLFTRSNINVPYSNIYSIFREPRKELAEPLGSAALRVKNTAVHSRL
jgi:hypothetical protein